MTDSSIYNSIAKRTGGDIYIGVVGPVRSGKSTFIKKFMENLVLPNIADENVRERARDEMPQSASGRTVMTTEPKFVPDEAVSITLDGGDAFRVKMVDCVGYLVDGALGHIENGEPRMVMTPWSEERIPFEQAASIGTKKVIEEHSTIGLVITTDGSISEIPREDYIEPERKVINELKNINKPFIVLLNSAHPERAETKALAKAMSEEYGVGVTPVDCTELTESDIKDILSLVMYEFPVAEILVKEPSWINVLPDDQPLKKKLFDAITACAMKITKIKDIKDAFGNFLSGEDGIKAVNVSTDLGKGSAKIEITVPDAVFYRILGEQCGYDIPDEHALISLMTELSASKRKYDKVAKALDDVYSTGYGIVSPSKEDMTLEEPEIVKQSGGYGVKLKASAPSIHMIKADVETEVSPIVGTAEQSEQLVKFLLKEFEEDPAKIWDSNMFGKTLHELVSEGLNTKLTQMPEDARKKLANTLRRIINEGSGGLICILL